MHHTRRRSGHGLPNTSMTDVRKAATANDVSSKHKLPPKQTMPSSRRTLSSHTSKTGKAVPSGRDAEKEQEEDHWFEDERESFPQFCMTCEKQFVAKDDRFLYCSEACRDYDQEYGNTISTQHFMDTYANNRSYSIYATDNSEPRDIIPRASPSRPSSTYFSPPPTPAKTSSTLPTSSAIAALRSLSIRDASPPSPTVPPTTGIWPFTTRYAAASPSSYARPSATVYASTYDHGYYHHAGATNYYGSGSGATGSERPLPPRRPGSYSRPKSIELVTPLIGQ